MAFPVILNFYETKSQASSFCASSFCAKPFCDKYHTVDNEKQADKELWITRLSLPP